MNSMTLHTHTEKGRLIKTCAIFNSTHAASSLNDFDKSQSLNALQNPIVHASKKDFLHLLSLSLV